MVAVPFHVPPWVCKRPPAPPPSVVPSTLAPCPVAPADWFINGESTATRETTVLSPVDTLPRPVDTETMLLAFVDTLLLNATTPVESDATPVDSDTMLLVFVDMLLLNASAPVESDATPVDIEPMLLAFVDTLLLNASAPVESDATPVDRDTILLVFVDTLLLSADIPVDSDAMLLAFVDTLPLNVDMPVDSETTPVESEAISEAAVTIPVDRLPRLLLTPEKDVDVEVDRLARSLRVVLSALDTENNCEPLTASVLVALRVPACSPVMPVPLISMPLLNVAASSTDSAPDISTPVGPSSRISPVLVMPLRFPSVIVALLPPVPSLSLNATPEAPLTQLAGV